MQMVCLLVWAMQRYQLDPRVRVKERATSFYISLSSQKQLDSVLHLSNPYFEFVAQ